MKGVTTPRRSSHRAEVTGRWRDDQGVTLALVAAALIVLTGAAALTIDLGNGWRTRQSLIPATDSGALAAAQDIVDGLSGASACTTAQNYVGQNSPGAVNVTCVTPFPTYHSSDQGQVTVTADHNVQTWFAASVGSGDYTVTSASTAVFGPPATVTRLRPMALCVEANSDIENAVNSPPAPGSSIVTTVFYDDGDCADSEDGNMGRIDFDGSGDYEEWVLDGYPEPVSFGNDWAGSCSSESHCYPGEARALSGSLNSELNSLENSGIYFAMPVFDYADGDYNAEFHLMGILRVRLIDHKVYGSESSRFLKMEIKPGLIAGTCCGPAYGASGNKVTTICAVDLGDYDACDP